MSIIKFPVVTALQNEIIVSPANRASPRLGVHGSFDAQQFADARSTGGGRHEVIPIKALLDKQKPIRELDVGATPSEAGVNSLVLRVPIVGRVPSIEVFSC